MGNVDTTVANMSTSSESVGVIRWGDWSISRTIMPTEGGRGVVLASFSGEGGSWEEGEQNRWTRWKSVLKEREGIKEENDRC